MMSINRHRLDSPRISHTQRNDHINLSIRLIVSLTSFSSLTLFSYLVANYWMVECANVAINNRTVEDWMVVDLKGANTYKPTYMNNSNGQWWLVVPHDEISHWPVKTYYWQAPKDYYQWKIYTYGGDLKFLVNHIVTRGDTSGRYLDEPDLVLEGGSMEHHMKIGYLLPKEEDILEGYDKNRTIKMPLSEPGWYHLTEHEERDDKGVTTTHLKLGNRPVSRAEFSLVLAGLDRTLVRAKYHMDQVEGDLYDVNMRLLNNRSRTSECDNDCAGVLLDDLDDIGLLFDEIRRLAPGLKNGHWKRLEWLKGRADNLEEALSRYLKLIAQGNELIANHSANLETPAYLLDLQASALDTRAVRIAIEAYQVRLMTEKTLEDLLKNLLTEIDKIIRQLGEHGFGPSGVSASSIEVIVEEAEMILRELRARNLRPYLDDAEKELRKAKSLLDRIRTLLIDPEKSNELLKRLDQLNLILDDFKRIVQDQVRKPYEKANALVADGKKKYQMLLALLKDAANHERESNANLDEAKRMLEITKKCLSDEAEYLDQLPRQIIELNSSIHEIEVKRSILTSVNPEYQKKYVDTCRKHGEELINKSRELDGLFNATRDVADYAMRAANAYRKIFDAIEGAEKAAKRAFDAAEKAYKVAVPDFDESLADKARESKRKSLELLEKAKRLRDQDVQRLSIEIARRRQLVDQLFEDMKGLAAELAQINAGLKLLADKNFFEQLQELDAFLKKLLERIAEIHKRLQMLSDIIYNNLIPQFERLSAGSQSSLGNVSQVLDSARKDLLAAIKYSASSKVSLEKILKLEAKLDIDLDLLRRKVQLAHEEATSIHVSLMPNAETGVCTRSYYIPAVASASDGESVSVGGFNVRQLSLVWSSHNADDTDSLLLFIGKGDEFLAVEMYERRIRLVFNLNAAPGGTQVLTHPKLIDYNDKGLLNDEFWYLIGVSVGSDDQLRLSVKSVLKAHEKDAQQVISQRLAGGSRTSRLAVSPYGEADVEFYVGGLPSTGENSSPPSQLRSTRLTGCLFNLQVNKHQVGLWNFKTSVGCEGCVEGASEPAKDTAFFSFSGLQSYANVGQNLMGYDRTRYIVSMSVRTSDADALLFLSLSETTNHYLSVALVKGRVVYLVGKLSPLQVNYLGLSSSALFEHAFSAQLNGTQQSSPLEHSVYTNREYNSGQWVRISVEKDQKRLVLAVDDELKESVVDDRLLTLDMDQAFFGGVWPLVRPKRFANSTIEFRSFSGCMKDVQIDANSVDLLARQSLGVETGCSSHSGRPRTIANLPRVLYPLPAGR